MSLCSSRYPHVERFSCNVAMRLLEPVKVRQGSSSYHRLYSVSSQALNQTSRAPCILRVEIKNFILAFISVRGRKQELFNALLGIARGAKNEVK